MLQWRILQSCFDDFLYDVGVTRSFFEVLLGHIGPIICKYVWTSEGLQLSRGTTHESVIPPAHQLWLCLRWLRHYAAERYLGNDNNIGQTTLYRNNMRVLFLLKALFDEYRVIRFPTPSERHEKHNAVFRDKEIAFIIDGNEQPIERPKGSSFKRLCYWSGKDKDYTLILLIVVGPDGTVYFISMSYPGKLNNSSNKNPIIYFIFFQAETLISKCATSLKTCGGGST